MGGIGIEKEQRYWRRPLVMAVVLLLLFTGSFYWISRPAALSAEETSLLGTWRAVPNEIDQDWTPYSHIYERDRTVTRIDGGAGQHSDTWKWRVEDGVLIVQQRQKFLDRLLIGGPPDIARAAIISVSKDQLVLGSSENPIVFERDHE